MKRVIYPLIAIFLVIIVISQFIGLKQTGNINHFTDEALVSSSGVCPPFHLYDEDGNIINPVEGINVDKTYSPKQTCGKCHDYDKITEGYHFQQGKGEYPTDIQKQRLLWASTPGNYGGSWCSPHPLYPYLSPKENDNEKSIGLTSYTFITSCGVCHPGGGPVEYDRNNKRYDRFMADTSNRLVEGGKNNLDGDYYKSKWVSSGVIEADCYLCHLPQYSNSIRTTQIKKQNFRYAALAASGFGTVSGSIADGEPVTVSYNVEMFNPDGTVSANIIRSPRNSVCLWCHAKPGYKKRGADFSLRNDVHLNAGLKCVDCHPAGMQATDPRIRGKEVHQFGKGDDPGGLVRNDLDNTLRSCTDCHNTGYLGAPFARHRWLPPLHLEKISCQACHIPERYVKSAHYAASDVFNPGAKILDINKHVWTFYGPDMNYWNHYGDGEMMGYDDKPTFAYRPELVNYKGEIFPVNRVHSSWPAIKIEGKEGLMQPKMSDVYKMWKQHRDDPTKYPELAKITDDSGDGIIEVNRPEEIDALIASITMMLNDIEYPMIGKSIVWVINNRVYTSGKEFTEIPMREWEASAYGNVHKYSHDILPARSALGSNGCVECHSFGAPFFFSQILLHPFDENGVPVTQPQYKTLGISGFMAKTGAFRESVIKPVVYFISVVLLVFLIVNVVLASLLKNQIITNRTKSLIMWLISAGLLAAGVFALFAGDLTDYMFPARMFLDANHFLFSLIILIAGIWFYIKYSDENKKPFRPRVFSTILTITILSGIFMLIRFDFILTINRLAYTIFDLSLLGILVCCALCLEKALNTRDA